MILRKGQQELLIFSYFYKVYTGRSHISGGRIRSYRFGYNGKEKANELYGEGNLYDYGFRIYDPRVARFFSEDPLMGSFLWWSPYAFAGNTPIQAIDLDGKEIEFYVFREGNNLDGECCATKIDLIYSITTSTTIVPLLNGAFNLKVDQDFENAGIRQVFVFYDGQFRLVPTELMDRSLLSITDSEWKSFWTLDQTIQYIEDIKHMGDVAATAVNLTVAAKNIIGLAKVAYKIAKQAPKVIAQINRRHYLNSKTIASSSKTEPGTFAPKEILDEDIATYNKGDFTKTTNGDVLINGRQYGLKNDGKTLFPRSGGAPEFIDLTRGQIKAIQLIRNTPIEKMYEAINGSGLSNDDLKFAIEFIKKY